MKYILLLLFLNTVSMIRLNAQSTTPNEQQRNVIAVLIDQYAKAREKRDTALLKTILMTDIDQLVSTGEWRNGIAAAVEGMLRSSANAPGTRTLTIDRIRMLDGSNAIVDCRYEIKNDDGDTRKMWSTFIIASDKGAWKISAIRNMLPSEQ